jgi:two-component system, chemotaxis family, chemotaxis protein CheY
MYKKQSIKLLRFLVVDDYESMRTLVQEELEELGVTSIATATSGNEALLTIQKLSTTDQSIEFVITDMVMDNGTGNELTQALRKSEHFKNLPILMISSMSEAGSILGSVHAGIDDYIVKPWDTDNLLHKLNQIAQKRGLV